MCAQFAACKEQRARDPFSGTFGPSTLLTDLVDLTSTLITLQADSENYTFPLLSALCSLLHALLYAYTYLHQRRSTPIRSRSLRTA